MIGLPTKSPKEELEEKLEDILFGLRPKKTVSMKIADCLSKNHEDGGSLYDALYAAIITLDGFAKEFSYAWGEEMKTIKHLCNE